jgi:hypothetical protein
MVQIQKDKAKERNMYAMGNMEEIRNTGNNKNRELTKNILRGRSCDSCDRRRRSPIAWCDVSSSKPIHDVCSQWKMGWRERVEKERKHKINVKQKRKAKKKKIPLVQKEA